MVARTVMVRCGTAAAGASAGGTVSTLGMVAWCAGMFTGRVTLESRTPSTWRGQELVCLMFVGLSLKTMASLSGHGAVFGQLFMGLLGVFLSRGSTAFETVVWCIGGGHLPEVPGLDLLHCFVTGVVLFPGEGL